MINRKTSLVGAAAALLFLSVASEAGAHWSDQLWASGYNIVVRPASDVITVPAKGIAGVDLWVQNNMGYPLVGFELAAQAEDYTLGLTRMSAKVPGTLLPGEKAKYRLVAWKSGGGKLPLASLELSVRFGEERQSSKYGVSPAQPIMIRKADGSLVPNPAPGLGEGGMHARQLQYAALADFGETGPALDKLLQLFCAGRGSWDSSEAVDQKSCVDPTVTVCPKAMLNTPGAKTDYPKLWAALELAIRKSALGPRAKVFRERLKCAAADENLSFSGFALMMLGYLGEDAEARKFLDSTADKSDDLGLIAKAALLIMGKSADKAELTDEVKAGLSSENIYVASACAAALGIANKDDKAVEDLLIKRVSATSVISNEENGASFYVSHLLSLVARDRRGWAPKADERGAVSFYGEPAATRASGALPAPGEPAAPVGITCRAGNRRARLEWHPAGFDVKGHPTLTTRYKVYYGENTRPRNATKPGEHGFNYDKVVEANATSLDLPSLGSASTYYIAVMAFDPMGRASKYSEEITCVP